MRHTPGPWEADECEIHAECGAHVASVSCSDDFACLDESEHEEVDELALGNAALIAAAPDLLEVCQRAVKAISDEVEAAKGKYTFKHLSSGLITHLDRVIAKAKGGAS